MKQITVTLFASSTAAGRELQGMLTQAFASRRFAGFDIDLDVVVDGDQEALMIAGLRNDIVIFDASVEDDVGSNYRAAQMWPCTMDHFLVVSRTPVPLNFLPFHDGGTPETSEMAVSAPDALRNDYLLAWIERQIARMGDRLPRPADERMTISPGAFAKNWASVLPLVERLIEASLARRRAGSGSAAFVSYLSRYSAHSRRPATAGGRCVEDLVQYIRERQADANMDVVYFPPGSLTNEFLTEHRRWQVLAMIDARLRRSTEVWIFETDDYYDSWWTQAELASLAYLGHSGDLRYRKSFPKVMLCRVQDGRFVHEEAAPDFIQRLPDPVARVFGRYLSNSDPLTMGYEGVKNMQRLGAMPRPVQWLAHKGLGWVMKRSMSGSSMAEDILNDDPGNPARNFARFREMLRSPVYQDSFWTDRIVACPTCCRGNRAKQAFDVETFMTHRQPGLKRVSPDEMQTVLRSGRWRCDACGHCFAVIEEEHAQFRWWPVRCGRPTGPGGVYVERLPVYTLSDTMGPKP